MGGERGGGGRKGGEVKMEWVGMGEGDWGFGGFRESEMSVRRMVIVVGDFFISGLETSLFENLPYLTDHQLLKVAI